VTRRWWLLLVAGPTLLMVLGGLVATLVLPYPIPRQATPAQRLWLTHCATCHGADGRGSWRATLLLIRPGDLADAKAMDRLPDDYLASVIRDGGAVIGKPGMPAYGYHLSAAEISELVAYLRRLPQR
jgi:mono/diheme cytochrome c family protein